MILSPHSLWAYLGPETTLPLVSMLGTVVGIVLIFWHFLLGFVKKLFRMLLRKEAQVGLSGVVPTPEGVAIVGKQDLNGKDGPAA